MFKLNSERETKTEAGDSSVRRVFIKSYGCQMNVYDADRMADVMDAQGYLPTSKASDADLIILNTCHIREKAAEKVFSELGKLKILKKERAASGQETMIAVAGCVAQAEGAEIVRRQNAVDLVLGPQNYHRLPELLDQARLRPGLVDTDFPVEDKFRHLPNASSARLAARGVSAFVTVQEGCDKFCAFCVVPYTRGAEVSRPLMDVLAEVDQLTRAGASEITLIGQNVNAYHGAGEDGAPATLARLVDEVAKNPRVVRIRYTTSHPNDMSDDLIAAHRDQPKLMPYLHLPIQSGSDRVLERMNRKHRAAEYLDGVRALRAARPDLAFSSDFIVGFPGETEEDFEATLRLVQEVRFASAYSFKYSARPGTPAAEVPDHIPEAVKSSRLARLQALLDEQRHAFNASMVGRELDVLFEKTGRHAGQLVGKSPYLQPVFVHADEGLVGTLARVRIVAVGSNSLAGELLDAQKRL